MNHESTKERKNEKPKEPVKAAHPKPFTKTASPFVLSRFRVFVMLPFSGLISTDPTPDTLS